MVDVRIVPNPAQYYSTCYIDFTSEDEAKSALAIDRTVVEGKTLFVALSKPQDEHENTLFLNNLPFNVPKDELDKALRFCKADILSVNLKKSYAFVKFKDEFAMKKHHKTLKNQKVMVNGRRIIAKRAANEENRSQKGDNDGQSSVHSPLASVSKDHVAQLAAQEAEGVLGKREPLDPWIDESPKVIRENTKVVHEREHKKELVHAEPIKEHPTSGPSQAETTKPASKSNADFRKLLNLKKSS